MPKKKPWDGKCPSSDNPSPSGFCQVQTYADFDKNTFEDRCKFCGRVARTGVIN